MHEKQLDALRAFAVAAVFYAHFADESSWAGVLGVRVFFVLSGFLITRILLQARPESGGRGQALGAFYARRFLRILPIYFVTLGLTAILFWDEVRPSLAWHALFGSNFWFALHDDWNPWFLAHLWSLSVEEQFYLVWPMLMLFAPVRALGAICLGGVALSLGFRLFWPQGDGGGDLLTPAALDALAAGALLAVHRERGDPWPKWAPWALAGAGAALFAVVELSPQIARLIGARLEWIVFYVAPVMVFVPLVGGASAGFKGIGGWLLNLAPLRALGRISYGLYLFHMPVFALVNRGLVPHRIVEPGFLRLGVVGGLTVVAATASWILFERPINDLKRNFRYRADTPARPAAKTDVKIEGNLEA